jgi:death-on-curing protein
MIHERTLVLHGGARGVRDQALLDSALARPRQIAGYEPEADIVRLAAALTFGVVRNHPFVDGNKRTGFVIGVLFLELNGFRFGASEEAAASQVMALAGGELDEAGYEAFLRENVIRE